MKSLGVLHKEKEIMEKFIILKRSKNEDSDEIEIKKQLIDLEISRIQSEIEFEILDLVSYKQIIQNQLIYEEELLKIVKLDKNVKSMHILIERINNRIEIIKDELEQQVEVNNEVETAIGNNTESNVIELRNEVSMLTITPEEQKENEKNELINKLSTSLDQYREAIDYFIIIENSSQAEDTRSKAQLLYNTIKKLQNGELKAQSVEEFSLALPLTPEYICGCSKKERISNFANIIKQFIGQKNDISLQMKKTLENFKTEKNKKELLQMKDKIKLTLDSLKAKINKITATIKKLKEIVQDPWTPLPIVTTKEIEDKKEKINQDVDVNTILLNIGELSYKSKNNYIHLNFAYSNSKNLNEYVNQNGNNLFEYSNKIKVCDKFDLKALTKKNLEVELFQKGCWCFKDKKIGDLQIRMEDLKSKSEIKGYFEFITEENRHRSAPEKKSLLKDPLLTPKIFISIKLRTPVMEREYEELHLTEIEITKYFPSFKSDFRNQNKKIVEKDTEEIVLKTKPKEISENKLIETSKSEIKLSSNIKVDPKEFSQEELEYPDILSNLNSVKVLQLKLKKYEDKISKIEGRAPKEIRERFLKCKVKLKTLENEMGSGNITIDQYILLMKTQLDHDKKLHIYLQTSNQEDKAKLVAERIQILITELEEAIDYAKTTK